jgi:polyhydroxyalkanoate synthase
VSDRGQPGPPASEQTLGRELRAQLAAVTGGLAPEDYTSAFWDWYLHLAAAPAAQLTLAQSAWTKALDNWHFVTQAALAGMASPAAPAAHPAVSPTATPTATPANAANTPDTANTAGPAPPPRAAAAPPAVPVDRRFADPAWKAWPFNVYAHAYGNWESWWKDALGSVPGVSAPAGRTLDFVARQMLDATSPAHYLQTNPELLERTRAESGQNLVRGYRNWLEDVKRTVDGAAPAGKEAFVVGRDLAVTPGKVVLRNRLIELIQYSPQTPSVHAEPILITPAWIMKYYILDLSPRNSLVRYLVEQGYTVFMVSWRNPSAADRDLGMDDYLRLGFRDALDAVTAIVPERQVHAVGYCIGGTLLAIAAAQLAAEGDRRLKTITLLAAQTDFSEPGELSVFISPAQLAMLDAVMEKAGVLKSEQMGGAFLLLRSADLLWAPAIESYVRGERPKMNDLMAWNSDGTRMPARMHSEYLHHLYLENDLASGRFSVAGRPVDLAAIETPMFVVGTETDHVAPWRSVYKVRGLTRSTDYSFLLTSGGHNAGIVSGPSHPKRRHRVLTWQDASTVLGPDEWLAAAPLQPGSWWPTWQAWLAQHSAVEPVPPPPLGNAAAGYPPLESAPGTYVLE